MAAPERPSPCSLSARDIEGLKLSDTGPRAHRAAVGDSPIALLNADVLDEIARLVVPGWQSYADGRSLALVSSAFRDPAQLALLASIRTWPSRRAFAALRATLDRGEGRGSAVRHVYCHADDADAAWDAEAHGETGSWRDMGPSC